MNNNYLKSLRMKDEEDRRVIYLTGEICEESVQDVIKQINEINELDNLLEEEHLESKTEALTGIYIHGEDISVEIQPLDREPILLYIDSSGGEVYSGFGLVNVMNSSATDIITIVRGKAMSMAFLIALAGKKRYAYKNTTFMYHDVSTSTYGKTEEFKREVKEMERIGKKYDDLVSEWSYITQEELDDKKIHVIDWYFDGVKAIDLGVIDELIDCDEYIGKCSYCGKLLENCECEA